VVVRPLKKWKPLRNTYWSLTTTTTSELEGLSESIFYTCTFVQFFFFVSTIFRLLLSINIHYLYLPSRRFFGSKIF
jgi:hypothetical protein